MAPEVFRHEPYNLKVDVYSFAMIVFQVCACVFVCVYLCCLWVILFMGAAVGSPTGCSVRQAVTTCVCVCCALLAAGPALTARLSCLTRLGCPSSPLQAPLLLRVCLQLFECCVPFAGVDPVEAARSASMLNARPTFPPRAKLTPVEAVGGAGDKGQGWGLESGQAVAG